MNETNNIITHPEFSSIKNDNRKSLTSKKLKEELNNETDIAWHSLKLGFINNAHWITILVIILVICLIVDLYTCLIYWHNPVILFK